MPCFTMFRHVSPCFAMIRVHRLHMPRRGPFSEALSRPSRSCLGPGAAHSPASMPRMRSAARSASGRFCRDFGGYYVEGIDRDRDRGRGRGRGRGQRTEDRGRGTERQRQRRRARERVRILQDAKSGGLMFATSEESPFRRCVFRWGPRALDSLHSGAPGSPRSGSLRPCGASSCRVEGRKALVGPL